MCILFLTGIFSYHLRHLCWCRNHVSHKLLQNSLFTLKIQRVCQKTSYFILRTPQIEAEALQLYERHCSGRSDGGNDGNLYVYCKRARENIEENLQHQIEVTPGPDAPKQVVFVQPPSYNYNHDITLTGGAGKAQKTVIYVLPSKNSHNVNYNDERDGEIAPEKPSLYFLGNGGESDSKIDSGSVTPPPAAGYRYNAPQQGGLAYN